MSIFFNILLLVSFGLCHEEKLSVDELLGKKFEFGLFENIDGSRKVYQQEEILLNKFKVKNGLKKPQIRGQKRTQKSLNSRSKMDPKKA